MAKASNFFHIKWAAALQVVLSAVIALHLASCGIFVQSVSLLDQSLQSDGCSSRSLRDLYGHEYSLYDVTLDSSSQTINMKLQIWGPPSDCPVLQNLPLRIPLSSKNAQLTSADVELVNYSAWQSALRRIGQNLSSKLEAQTGRCTRIIVSAAEELVACVGTSGAVTFRKPSRDDALLPLLDSASQRRMVISSFKEQGTRAALAVIELCSAVSANLGTHCVGLADLRTGELNLVQFDSDDAARCCKSHIPRSSSNALLGPLYFAAILADVATSPIQSATETLCGDKGCGRNALTGH